MRTHSRMRLTGLLLVAAGFVLLAVPNTGLAQDVANGSARRRCSRRWS